MKTQLLAIGLMTILVGSTGAEAKPARCLITSSSTKSFKGPCDYKPDSSTGGFALSRLKGRKFLNIDPITVSVVSPGVAQVSGLTKEGVNSTWGEAKRSKRDPACWIGEDFKICAR